MRVASMVLGIIGAVAGLGGAIFVLFVGGVDAAFSASGTSTVVGLGVAAVLFSILGLAGSIFTLKKPKTAGILMLLAALGGLISISWYYVIAFPLLLLAGILSLVSQRKENTTSGEGEV